jgi:hypothetical protein
MQIAMAMWKDDIFITVKQVDLAVHSFVSLTNAATKFHILSFVCLTSPLFSIYVQCKPKIALFNSKGFAGSGLHTDPYWYLQIRHKQKTCPRNQSSLV